MAGALDGDDVIDGGTGNDFIAGDNAECCFRNDLLDPRMRALTGTAHLRHEHPIGTDGLALVTGTVQNDPTASARRGSTCSTTATPSRRTTPELCGNDYIAGGAGADEIWGELGNDVIQGDGYIDGLVLPVYTHDCSPAIARLRR